MRNLLFSLVSLAGLGGPVAADTALLALPEIDIIPSGEMLDISGRVVGLRAGTVTAILVIEKSDSGGRVKTDQSREISVTAGSSEIVASTRLSALQGLTLDVSLLLQSQGTHIGSTTVTIGDATD